MLCAANVMDVAQVNAVVHQATFLVIQPMAVAHGRLCGRLEPLGADRTRFLRCLPKIWLDNILYVGACIF